ncbi:MAG: alpha/beta hydrolase family protein [Candidatus Aminicenantes bacterium RBG_16_66_30]
MPVTEKQYALVVNGTSAPAVVTVPGPGDAVWGLVLVPGSFLNDVDGNYLPGHGNPFTAKPHAYKDLARQLAGRGCAVLRYARGGVTVLDKELAQAHRHFADRTAVVAEAVRVLRAAVPSVKRIALAGHSEGGPVSLLLLTTDRETRIDAYISLSAPALRMFDIMRQQTAMSVKDGMASFGPVKYPFAAYERAMALVREGTPVPADLMKQLPPMGVWAMDEASRRYLREYDEIDSRKLIAELACPVLIVQGKEDTSVYPDNAGMLFEARKGNAAPTDIALFPGLQHFYKRVTAGLDPMAAFGLETESDPAVAEAIGAWLDKMGPLRGGR